ncbi:SCO-spondin-like, partial [Antedon mediterranea]|uniref:SCO-spondin-like n=1 Tax=Antedon mediterranea TaxID=105859 RepID=UPI003AF9F4EF
CNAVFYDTYGNEINCEGSCPDGIPVVNCLVDPCQFAECPASPSALCVSNFCGNCNAVFYDNNGNQVNCDDCRKQECAFVCPFGNVLDENGCQTCACLQAPCNLDEEPANCLTDPCKVNFCFIQPSLCIPNFCNGCDAFFYDTNGNAIEVCRFSDCRGDLVFNECASACPTTCDNLDEIQICILLCVPKCACPSGTILKDLNSTTCVPPEQCHCPQIKCANPCPFGTEVTAGGCPTCTCLSNPATCLDGSLPVSCVVNPCEGTICEVNPMTSCVPNYCGGCFADFYDRNLNLDFECLEASCRGDLVLNTCGSACPVTCENLNNIPACIELCVPKCDCPHGMVPRELDSIECVLPEQCNADCVGDLVFNPCGSACPVTCDNLSNIPACIELCVPKCDCPHGMVPRELDSIECVLPEQCNAHCASDLVFNPCGSACPVTCDNLSNIPACIELCVPKCDCPPGMVPRELDSIECVLPEQCNADCAGDLVFNPCGSACPVTCGNIDETLICSTVCVPKCTCPTGMVLKHVHSTTCVLPGQCNCTFLQKWFGLC